MRIESQAYKCAAAQCLWKSLTWFEGEGKQLWTDEIKCGEKEHFSFQGVFKSGAFPGA